MLPDKGAKLADLGALRDVDAVLVAEFLELGLVPGVDELVGNGGERGLSAGGGASGGVLSAEGSKARITANGRNQLVSLDMGVSIHGSEGMRGTFYLTVVGCGTGMPYVSSHSLKSDSTQS